MKAMGSLGAMIGRRTQMEQGWNLTVSFVDYKNPNTPPLSPDVNDAGYRAYGRAYQFGFDKDEKCCRSPSKKTSFYHLKNMLDLSTISDESFGCIQYRVIRRSDWLENPGVVSCWQ
ncbi:MAG: hypothetical protein R2827_01180 [Bdellovibrionales bacterium]